MTFTYEPTTSNLDEESEAGRRDIVRFLLADTDEKTSELSDEEIAWALARASDRVYVAALVGVDHLIATYARRASSKDVGTEIRVQYQDKVDELKELRRRLENEMEHGSPPKPWAGGLSELEREHDLADADLVRPRFHRGMFGHREDV